MEIFQHPLGIAICQEEIATMEDRYFSEENERGLFRKCKYVSSGFHQAIHVLLLYTYVHVCVLARGMSVKCRGSHS